MEAGGKVVLRRVLGQESPFGSHGNTLRNTEKVPVSTAVSCWCIQRENERAMIEKTAHYTFLAVYYFPYLVKNRLDVSLQVKHHQARVWPHLHELAIIWISIYFSHASVSLSNTSVHWELSRQLLDGFKEASHNFYCQFNCWFLINKWSKNVMKIET